MEKRTSYQITRLFFQPLIKISRVLTFKHFPAFFQSNAPPLTTFCPINFNLGCILSHYDSNS